MQDRNSIISNIKHSFVAVQGINLTNFPITGTPFESVELIPVKTNQDILDLFRLGEFQEEMCEIVRLEEKKHSPPHIHNHSDAEFHFLCGTGRMVLNAAETPYGPGDIVKEPRKTAHGFRTSKDTIYLSIQKLPILDKMSRQIDIEYLCGDT